MDNLSISFHFIYFSFCYEIFSKNRLTSYPYLDKIRIMKIKTLIDKYEISYNDIIEESKRQQPEKPLSYGTCWRIINTKTDHTTENVKKFVKAVNALISKNDRFEINQLHD